MKEDKKWPEQTGHRWRMWHQLKEREWGVAGIRNTRNNICFWLSLCYITHQLQQVAALLFTLCLLVCVCLHLFNAPISARVCVCVHWIARRTLSYTEEWTLYVCVCVCSIHLSAWRIAPVSSRLPFTRHWLSPWGRDLFSQLAQSEMEGPAV